MPNLNKSLVRQAKKLAHTECCNFYDGECIADDVPCHVVNMNFPTIREGAISCDYFLDSVLGLDPDLHTAVWKEILRDESDAGAARKACAYCGKPFYPASNRQKVCRSCRPLADKIRAREKQRRYYRRKAEKEG